MTSDLLAHGLAMAHAGSRWLGPILACAAFAEAMVVLGVFIPLTPFLILAGAVLGAGALDQGTPVWVSAGAFLGNAVSFHLGRQVEGAVAARLALRPLAMASAHFRRHGAAAIVITRFIGPPAIAPVLAGSLGLSLGRFMIANLVASAIWPPAMIGLGVLCGRTLALGAAHA